MLKPFLSANWRYLAMLNFAVDSKILAPHVPAGTEVDFHNDKTYLSVVGFLFYHTIVCGLPIPRHRNFEEVNLRFYVRKKSADTWRRGVVFIRELVPKIAIAVTARVFYGEPYLALPMRSEVEDKDGIVRAKYEWRRGNKWEHLAMNAHGEAQSCALGSHEQFITEHYWGYTKRGEDRTDEYKVEHPKWDLFSITNEVIDVDFGKTYGGEFAFLGDTKPYSVLLAKGSEIAVYKGKHIQI